MKNIPYPWNNLMVELAVKIYESLYKVEDNFSPIYEFMDESKEIVEWCVDNQDRLNENNLEKKINDVLSLGLNHQYEGGAFGGVSLFVLSRIQHFKATYQI